MKYLLPFLYFAVLLVSCEQPPKTTGSTEIIPPAEEKIVPDTDDRTYVPGKSIGIFQAGMTADDLRKLYGADQVKEATLYGPEGMTYPGFHLFPGTDDELNISIDSVGFLADTYNPGSHWASAQHGVRIGTSLEDLERLNGGPFIFSGFDWDYGGNVYDWLGGELDGYSLQLGYDNNYIDFGDDKAFVDYAVGDQPVRSDGEPLKEKGIRVSRIYMSGSLE